MALDISMPCGFLGGVLENHDSLKDIRWLLRVRPPDQGVIILLVSKLTIFKIFLPIFITVQWI